MPKYDKLYIIRKLLCSTFRICKKNCKFAKIEFFIAKSSYIVKKNAKKIVQKMKNYTFLKSPWPCHFKYAKKNCIILNNLIFNQEKTKNVQISFDRLFAKNLQFFSQNLCNSFPYVKGFPKSLILSKSDKWKWVKTKI